MSDDTDLTRLFAQGAELPADDAFVAGVTARIAGRRRLRLALPVLAALGLLVGIWLSWPVAFDFSSAALDGLGQIAQGAETAFNSPLGMATATVLLATAVFWTWLYERVRANT